MYTVITFWFSLSPSGNMLFTSDRSWKDYWRTRCLSRAANFTLIIMFFPWACSLLCVCVEPEKIQAVLEWPVKGDPEGVAFPGIWTSTVGLSMTIVKSSPLMKRTSGNMSFSCSPEATNTWEAQTIVIRWSGPGSAWKFIVEVETSDIGSVWCCLITPTQKVGCTQLCWWWCGFQRVHASAGGGRMTLCCLDWPYKPCLYRVCQEAYLTRGQVLFFTCHYFTITNPPGSRNRNVFSHQLVSKRSVCVCACTTYIVSK